MLRQTFDQKLQTLQGEVLILGHIVDVTLSASLEALSRQDLPGAQRVLADNCTISSKRARLEAETLSQIATQQPVAGDLRTLAAVLEIAAELEQMGSYAASIAQITLNLVEQPLPEPCPQILLKMGGKARIMLRESLRAFAHRDVILARAIPAWDDEVDQLNEEIHHVLFNLIKTDPSGSHQAACLSRVAYNPERTADRVINICEWVVFAVTGEMKELNGSAG